MKAYDEIWGVAEDNYGVITSAQAEALGVSRQNLVAMEIESIDIENRLLHLRYYGLQRQGPDFRPAPHRIAVAQRVVSNPSRGSVTLYQIRDAA